MSVFIHGLNLKNYRGIGNIAQLIGPFKKCNFFIGTNNSGKSCVLNFLSSHLTSMVNGRLRDGSQLNFSPLEVHLGMTNSQVEVGVGFPEETALQLAKEKISNSDTYRHQMATRALQKLLKQLSSNGIVWTKASATNLSQVQFANGSPENHWMLLDRPEWHVLWNSMTNGSSGDMLEHWVPQTIEHILRKLKCTYPTPKIIPAKRQIGAAGTSFDDFSGAGLIDRLAELQNPRPTERVLKISFEKINRFLQDVTGDQTAMIEIPHDRHEVLVHKEDRVLPLSSLGTGIHEVVMIAAFCTLTEGGIVCIEEPEIHLHPLLQKKLIKYIVENTSNQYFIATHSASIIDQPDAAVFSVTHSNRATQIELITGTAQRHKLCHDLGYRASDLLQANAVIWVEGPSDRIYIKHWISAVDSTLIEGLHYSIMFYGGRLLSHLSANDEEINDFINLRRLNRNMAIVIDSDRANSRSKLNDTKTRIINEFYADSNCAWVTAGREIENYVSSLMLNKVLAKLYANFRELASLDKFSHSLHYFEQRSTKTVRQDADKVKVARAIAELPADLSVLDLRRRISMIVNMIRDANTHYNSVNHMS